MFAKIVNNCKASYNELVHKTTWPSKKELMSQALLVLSASLIIAIVVFLMDSAFEAIMKFVYPG